jgi:hemerythrin-like domain-containing protein
MKEHRLIEQIIPVLKTELKHISRDRTVHPIFIYDSVDFFRTYADRLHHGKEEDILFTQLKNKDLSDEHERIINELIEDHRYARKTVGNLVVATEKWSQGDEQALTNVSDCLNSLCELYPKHIEKEDKEFFLPSLNYFTKDEREKILNAGLDFDREFIHITYKGKMESLKKHK